MAAPPISTSKQENRFLRTAPYDWDRLMKDLHDFENEVIQLTKRANSGGDIGPPGPQGSPGTQGSTGQQGIQGIPGAAGINGLSAYEIAFYVSGFRGTVEQWLLSLQGLSAYQVAVRNGFVGTEAQWIQYLKNSQQVDDYGLIDVDYKYIAMEPNEEMEDLGMIV